MLDNLDNLGCRTNGSIPKKKNELRKRGDIVRTMTMNSVGNFQPGSLQEEGSMKLINPPRIPKAAQ
jgi:hypothetical protein